jgi:hypothetical protein
MAFRHWLAGAAALSIAACSNAGERSETARGPDGEAQAITDLRIISSDEMEGRLVGTEGNARARAYILERFAEIGLEPVGGGFEHPFDFTRPVDMREPDAEREELQGINLIARIPGTGEGGPVMVLGAHYDHVGVNDEGEIYNGADDNASGTAGLLALAQDFTDRPPLHDVIIVAFDAEEGGLNGARRFVAEPPVDIDSIGFMLNMDMIGYSPDGELYAVGTWHYPALLPVVEAAAAEAPVTLLTGYDEPTDNPRDDWTLLSDHGPFHMVGIPFLYLGVEDHEHYHQPSDTFENMTLDFFLGAVETAKDVARRVDAELAEIAAAEPRN